MRAQEFISEIERISKSGYEGGKDAMKFDYGREKTVRPLPGGSGLLYSITDGGGDYEIKIWDPRVKEFDPGEPPKRMSWMMNAEYQRSLERWKERNETLKRDFARSPGQLVGKLDVEAVDFPLKGAVQVNTITVDEDYRGGGIGKALYGIVLTIMKRPLIAGSSQTPGGRKNWASLSQIPGVELKGYVVVDDYDLDTDPYDSDPRTVKRAEQNIDTIMGQLGGQYIGNSRGMEYFAFDVQPNTTGNELQAYVDTKLTKIYSNDYRGRGDNGLYAVWTGMQESLDTSNEFVTEHFAVGSSKVGDTIFDIRVHALDRLEERHIPPTTARELLRRVDAQRDKIQHMEPGEPFWVFDPGLEISLGMRNLSSGRVQWGTTIIGHPNRRDGRYPVIELD